MRKPKANPWIDRYWNQGVAALLADPDKGRYFLAESKSGEPIGQLMITYEWSDWRNGLFWWLQSVYVTSEFRKQGVFSALLGEVSKLAESEPDVCGIRLYVDKNNGSAQATYQARGFEHANYELMGSRVFPVKSLHVWSSSVSFIP